MNNYTTRTHFRIIAVIIFWWTKVAIAQAQSVSFPNDFSPCVEQNNKIPIYTSGVFNADNQFFIEFYNFSPTGGPGTTLLASFPISIIDDSISINPPSSFEFQDVYVRIRSTSPAISFDKGRKTIFGIPSIIVNNKATVEAGVYNANQLVYIEFKYPNHKMSFSTVEFSDLSTLKTTQDIFIKEFFPSNTGSYGILSVKNKCGTNSSPKNALLTVKQQRLRLSVKGGEQICSNEQFWIVMQSDEPIPNVPITVTINYENGQAVNIPYTRNGNYLNFTPSQALEPGLYTVAVQISNANTTAETNFLVKGTPIHSVGGTFNVKYGDGVDLNYAIDKTDAPSYDDYYTELLLNDGQIVIPNSNGKVQIYNITESKTYSIENASGRCENESNGVATVNVLNTITIDSISATSICQGEEILFHVHSNGTLPFSNNYELQVGVSYTDNGLSKSFGFAEYNPIPITWINATTFKLTPAQYAGLNKLNAYYVAIRESNLNIAGHIFKEKIEIRNTPNPFFASDNYYTPRGNLKIIYTDNWYPSGTINMSDGNTYELHPNGSQFGYINFKAENSITGVFPVSASNNCGTNYSLGGSFNVNIQSPTNPGIYFNKDEQFFYCLGDSIKFDWEPFGTFSNGTVFKMQFLANNVLLHEVDITQGQKGIIAPLISSNSEVFRIRIKASNTSIISGNYSVWIVNNNLTGDIKLGRLGLGNYLFEENPTEIICNPKRKYYFKFNDHQLAKYYAEDGTEISQITPISIAKDSSLTIAYVTNGCDTLTLNKTFNFVLRPYHLVPKEVELNCDGSKLLVTVDYWVEGSTPTNTNIELWIAPLINNSPSNFIKLTTFLQNSNSISAFVNHPSFQSSDYAFKIVDPLNNLESNIFYENLTIQGPTKITSNLGNDIVSDRVPINLEVYLENGFATGSLNSPLFPINFEVPISTDTTLFAYYLENSCGFLIPTDSVVVNIIPHPISVNYLDVPCIETEDSLHISYARTEENFEPDANLQFYLWNGSSKILLPNGVHKNYGFTTPIPEGLIAGSYEIGFQRDNPRVDRLFENFNNWVTFNTRPYATVLDGTIYQYNDDITFRIPVYTEGGNQSYGIITNASELQEVFYDPLFPTYEYIPVTVNGEGYGIIEQSLLFVSNVDSINIIELRTSYGGCLGVSEGGVNIEYLDGSQRKIYAHPVNETDKIEILCRVENSLSFVLESIGTFGTSNLFIPQISDPSGQNFTDLNYSNSGNIFSVTLPSSLVAGEGYRIRFRSTDPVSFGASSSFLIIIKNNPSININGNTSITSGDSISLELNMNGETPFDIVFNNGLEIQNIPTNAASTYLKPVSSFTFSINSISDKYCSSNGQGSFAVTVLCKELEEIAGSISGNSFFTANSIESTASFENGSRTEINAGKFILLKPGFMTQNGAVFSTELGACPN